MVFDLLQPEKRTAQERSAKGRGAVDFMVDSSWAAGYWAASAVKKLQMTWDALISRVVFPTSLSGEY